MCGGEVVVSKMESATEYISKSKIRLMKVAECAGHTFDYAKGWKACADYLRSIPAADVRPVVRSEWEVVEKGLRYEIWKCKRCGDLLKVRKDTFNCGRGNCFFCPRCGAIMWEETEK